VNSCRTSETKRWAMDPVIDPACGTVLWLPHGIQFRNRDNGIRSSAQRGRDLHGLGLRGRAAMKGSVGRDVAAGRRDDRHRSPGQGEPYFLIWSRIAPLTPTPVTAQNDGSGPEEGCRALRAGICKLNADTSTEDHCDT
jgi:hypothetical protein